MLHADRSAHEGNLKMSLVLPALLGGILLLLAATARHQPR
jgi:hypothetical protein